MGRSASSAALVLEFLPWLFSGPEDQETPEATSEGLGSCIATELASLLDRGVVITHNCISRLYLQKP